MPLKILCHVVSSKLLQYFISLSDRSLHESIFKPHFRLDQIEDKNLFKIFDRRSLPVLKCFREHRKKKKKKNRFAEAMSKVIVRTVQYGTCDPAIDDRNF